MLEIDGLRLFDSRLILRYLFDEHPHDPSGEIPLAPSIVRPDRRWDDELILATVEAMTEAIVSLRLYHQAEEEEVTFLKRQRYRIGSCLDWLETKTSAEGFWPDTFSVMDLNIRCPLAFAQKRGIFRLDAGRWPKLAQGFEFHANRPSIVNTPVNEMPT